MLYLLLFVKMWNILHLFSLVFQGISKRLRADGNSPYHQFRNIVTLHELTMVVGIGARQFEGLSTVPVLVDMGDERAGEERPPVCRYLTMNDSSLHLAN